jgi:uncharacterized membrane protein
MAGKDTNRGIVDELPLDRLMEEALGLGKAFAKHGLDRFGGGLDSVTSKLNEVGGPGVSDMAKGAGRMVTDKNPIKGGAEMVKGGTKAAAGKVKDSVGDAVDAVTPGGKSDEPDLKVTNIVESIDVPVPRQVAYEEWTQFEEFPSFMKKVENVSQEDDDVVTWKAQVFWSHRTWKAKIIEQVPPERIVWKSEAEKGRVDGAVTFHELAPDLTRVLVSLEYHPQGLFERTGNLWRAQGRRVRLELKHFRRHIANHTLLHQGEVDGWTGEIHDGDVDKNPQKSAPKKSSSSGGSTATKSTAKKSTANKSTANRSTAKKSTAKKSSSGGRSTAQKSAPAKKTAAARKSTPKKSAPAKKTTAKKAPAKKSTAKKSTSSPRKRQTARSGS